MPAPAWVAAHRSEWERKPGLRRYYKTEYFDRIVPALPLGETLEIGAGPGFFTQYHRCTVVSDVTVSDHIDRVADVHALPFESGHFDAVVGIDVLHHFSRPIIALTEIARVLKPGGRLLMVEPWTTPLGRVFYRHIHHEECFAIADPWGAVFPPGKDPMEGNAEIPRTYFEFFAGETNNRTGLRVTTLEIFGLLGYLATGGFTQYHMGDAVTNAFMALDRWTPHPLRTLISLKAFIVAEKSDGGLASSHPREYSR